MTYLCKLPVKGGGVRGGSDVNHHMVCLCSILQKTVLWEWIDKNSAVTDKVKRPAQGDGRDSLLTEEGAGRWDAAKVKAGIDPDLHFHDLRRTFRSRMKMTRKEDGIELREIDSYTLNLIDGHANPKIEATCMQIDNDQLVRAISLLPDWNSHRTSTSGEGKMKGLEGGNPPALVFIGAEEGS